MLLAVGTISDTQLNDAMKRGYVAAFRWLRSADEAKDACQEAARKAWSARDAYDDRRPLYPWFYRILKNHCFDRLKGRRRTTALEQLPELAAGSPTAEARVLAREQALRIESAIEALPTDYAAVIELRHFQDASYEEMAEVLGVPVGTVMSRLYRARQKLREMLTDARADGGSDE